MSRLARSYLIVSGDRQFVMVYLSALAIFILLLLQISANGFPLTRRVTSRKHTDLQGMKGFIFRFLSIFSCAFAYLLMPRYEEGIHNYL